MDSQTTNERCPWGTTTRNLGQIQLVTHCFKISAAPLKLNSKSKENLHSELGVRDAYVLAFYKTRVGWNLFR